jgi:serine/threonine protein kinase
MGQSDVVPVLLLQFIPDPMLITYATETFSSTKISTLKSRALRIQQKIHSNGVCHRDIEPWNFLWNSETERLTLIDFDEATFDDWNHNPQLNKEEAQDSNALFVKIQERNDNEMLWSMLRDLGVRDERNFDHINCLIPKVVIE